MAASAAFSAPQNPLPGPEAPPVTTPLSSTSQMPLLAPFLASTNEPVALTTTSVIASYIREQARQYAVEESLALSIAWCESGFRSICNRDSCSFGIGVFQFIKSTWATNCSGGILNAQDNVDCAIKLLAAGATSHWGTKYTSAPLCKGEECWGSWACWVGRPVK
jgi:hypothetical protein